MENYSPRWEGKTVIKQPRPRVPLEKKRARKKADPIPEKIRQQMLSKVPAWALPHLVLQAEEKDLTFDFNLPENLFEALEPAVLEQFINDFRQKITELLRNISHTRNLYPGLKVLEKGWGVALNLHLTNTLINTFLTINTRVGPPQEIPLDATMIRAEVLKKLHTDIVIAKRNIKQVWAEKDVRKNRKRRRPKPTAYANRQREAAQDIRDLEVGGDRAIDPALKITNVHQMILQVRSNVMRRTAKNRLHG